MSRISFFVFCMLFGLAWQNTEAYAASADAVIVPADQMKVISATSNEAGAEAAIDGDQSTVWTVDGPFPQQLVFELPETYYITAIKYIHADKTNYLTDYSVYVSDDGQNWINTSAPGTLKNTSLVWEVRLTWPHEAKFVRIDYMGSGGSSINTADISVISEGVKPHEESPIQSMPPAPEPPKTTTPPPPSTPASAKPATPACRPAGSASVTLGNGKIIRVGAGGDFATIQDAVNHAQAGDTILVAPGVYRESVDIGVSGTADNPITIKSEVPGGAVIMPQSGEGRIAAFNFGDGQGYINVDGFVTDGAEGGVVMHFVWGNNTHDIAVVNNEVRNGLAAGLGNTSLGMATNMTSTRLTIANNVIHDLGTNNTGDGSEADHWKSYAMYFTASDSIVENNEMYNISGYGIHQYCSSTAVAESGGNCGQNDIFRNNIIHDTGYSGILFASAGNNNQLTGNTIYNTKGSGVEVGGWGGVEAHNNSVTNNTIYGNSGSAIQLGANSAAIGTVVQNNLMYGNGNDSVVETNAQESVIGNNFAGSAGSAPAGVGAGQGAGGTVANCAHTATPPTQQSPNTQQQANGASGSSGGATKGETTKPAASTGGSCFTLGGKDVPAEGYDPAAMWQNKEGVTVTAYSNMAAHTTTGLVSKQSTNGEARGIGIGGGESGEEIDKGEGMLLTFAQPQTNFSVGVRDLYTEGDMVEDGTETASWAAYKEGKVVAQGTVDATTPLNGETEGTGKAQFEISAPEGIDQLLFYSQENGSDFGLEYVQVTNPNGCGSASAGGSGGTAGGGSPSSGSGNSGNGSGQAAHMCGSASVKQGSGNTYFVSPGESINAALSRMQPGDTLIVKPGVYRESIDIGVSGTADNPITIKSEVPGGAIIMPQPGEGRIVAFNFGDGQGYINVDGFVTDGAEGGVVMHFVFGSNTHDIAVVNNEIRNGLANGLGAASLGIATNLTATRLTIANNVIHDLGTNNTGDGSEGDHWKSYAMYWTSSDSIVENNEIYNISGYGIHQYCSSGAFADSGGHCNQNNVFRNNIIHDTGYSGILFASAGNNNQFTGNTLYRTGKERGEAAIEVGGWGGVEAHNNSVTNNTIYDNYGAAVEIGGPAAAIGTVVQNNLIYGNGNDSILETNAPGSVIGNNFTGSPGSAPAGVGAGQAASPSNCAQTSPPQN